VRACACRATCIFYRCFGVKRPDVCALAPNADYVAKPPRTVGGGGWFGAERTGAARRDKLAMGASTYQRVRVWVRAWVVEVGVRGAGCAHCNYITAGPAYITTYYIYAAAPPTSLPSPARSPGFRKSFSSYPRRQSSTVQPPNPLPLPRVHIHVIIIIMI